MRLLTRLLSPVKRLEWYPPFRAMGIRVVFLGDDWREVRIRLPLSRFNRNPGGGMFGGAMAALADPVPALMCARIFGGYAVWTRAMSMDFQREARSDLELRIAIAPAQEKEIRRELDARQRATPTFEYAFFDSRDRQCAHVSNRVAIRPQGYRSSDGALGRVIQGG